MVTLNETEVTLRRARDSEAAGVTGSGGSRRYWSAPQGGRPEAGVQEADVH